MVLERRDPSVEDGSPTIRALSWNVNGLRSVHRKGLFLEWLGRESPDIVCLQETKSIPEQLPMELLQVQGYQAYFSQPERKGYSGVGLYTRLAPHQVSYTFGDGSFDPEGRVIVADYGHFVLFNVYFPNGKSSAQRLEYKMDFYGQFLASVDVLRGQGRSIIICGDVNTAHKEIDLARPKANQNTSGFLPRERAWIDQLINHGYLDVFRTFNDEPGQYTYWDTMTGARDRNVGWRIDYFFVDSAFAPCVEAAFIMADAMGSDHCPVGIDIRLPD